MASILVFPPKSFSNYTGGELILYGDDGTEQRAIIADDRHWTCVWFKLGTLHEVKAVTAGVRFVWKGFLYENM